MLLVLKCVFNLHSMIVEDREFPVPQEDDAFTEVVVVRASSEPMCKGMLEMSGAVDVATAPPGSLAGRGALESLKDNFYQRYLTKGLLVEHIWNQYKKL